MVVITFSRSHASRLQSWRGGGVERWRGALMRMRFRKTDIELFG
jgi:hypothetical protein